jgi:aminopeptidase
MKALSRIFIEEQATHMAMVDVRVRRWADTLVGYCLDVQPGDVVTINSTPLAEPLIMEAYRAVLRAGGHPLPQITLSSLQHVLLTEGSDEQIGWHSPVGVALAGAVDKRLNIAAAANPLALAEVDPRRQSLANTPPQMGQQTKKKATEKPAKQVRWCGTLYPTAGYAQLAGMALADFEEFVFAACFLNDDDPGARWRELGAQQQRYVDWLRDKHTVHVVADGVDLRLSIAGRTFINSDGKRNFPSGEFFTGPVEDSVEGHIRFDIPSSRDGRVVRDVRLRFEHGRVVEAAAREGEAYFLTMLDLDEGARRLGEFAFGNNFGITRGIINTLYDEKIGGTIHMALGQSYPETGGVNQSAIHWDFIRDLRQGGEVFVDDILFMRDGQFVVPELIG